MAPAYKSADIEFFPTAVAPALMAKKWARIVNKTVLDKVRHLLANLCIILNFCFFFLFCLNDDICIFVIVMIIV